MSDVTLVRLPYGKQLFARPSHHTSANMAFFVTLSYLYPLPEVIIPLSLCVILSALATIHMGFSSVQDVVYGMVTGGSTAALAYCTGFREWVLILPSWARFFVLVSPVLATPFIASAIKRFVPGVAAQHTDYWVSTIKKSHPDPNSEVVIDDRKLDVLFPNLAILLGLSIGAAIVPPNITPPLFVIGIGLAVYVIIAITISMSVKRSIQWLCVLAHFLLGCWVNLVVLIN